MVVGGGGGGVGAEVVDVAAAVVVVEPVGGQIIMGTVPNGTEKHPPLTDVGSVGQLAAHSAAVLKTVVLTLPSAAHSPHQ